MRERIAGLPQRQRIIAAHRIGLHRPAQVHTSDNPLLGQARQRRLRPAKQLIREPIAHQMS